MKKSRKCTDKGNASTIGRFIKRIEIKTPRSCSNLFVQSAISNREKTGERQRYSKLYRHEKAFDTVKGEKYGTA